MPPLHATGSRLIVWRHGETTHNASGLWQGQLDIPLSEVGQAQAAQAAPLLAARRPDLVVSSDLARAAQTADVLAGLLDVPVRRDERLREIHVGGWQGKSAEQVRLEFPEDADRLLTGEDFRRGGTGETVAEVAQRSLDCARDVVADLPDGGLAVIATHGVTARALVAGLVGLDQGAAWRVLAAMRNCHWAELVQLRSGQWRIETWNVGAAPAGPVTGAA